MLEIFAAHVQTGWMNNPLLNIAMVLVATVIFLKFCSWAKGFTLSKTLKMVIFILTGVGLVVFNIMYSMANKPIEHGEWGMATIVLACALVWVFVFAFALMAQGKAVEGE